MSIKSNIIKTLMGYFTSEDQQVKDTIKEEKWGPQIMVLDKKGEIEGLTQSS